VQVGDDEGIFGGPVQRAGQVGDEGLAADVDGLFAEVFSVEPFLRACQHGVSPLWSSFAALPRAGPAPQPRWEASSRSDARHRRFPDPSVFGLK